ncbi:MAG: cupin domain-containing protein [Alphaproteobacteria bacterium]|nr:cupin domain-containing protein [Alphaproteobacteria bacterium]
MSDKATGSEIAIGNLLAGLPARAAHELFETLMERPGFKLERIVSTGQASPPGFWYDQDRAEWVLVLQGRAGLRIAGEPAPRDLRPGDHVLIPAHVRHRVEYTDPDRPTVWLAFHFDG